MKKFYEVEVPNRIIFGDPSYWEDFADEKKRLKSLVCDLKLSKDLIKERGFKAKVLLQEEKGHEEEYDFDYTIYNMSIAIANEKDIDMYLNGSYYSRQTLKRKQIGVDTAKYYLRINKKDDEIYTAADGYWGTEDQYFEKGDRKPAAIVVDITFPEDDGFEGMKGYFDYFFPDAKLISEED